MTYKDFKNTETLKTNALKLLNEIISRFELKSKNKIVAPI